MDGIVLNNLHFNYPNKSIFRGISFNAYPSQITFLAGENGIGKTTWIKLATGRLKPLNGEITFNSKKITEIRDQISVVLDEPPIYEHLNGYDNLIALAGVCKLSEQDQLEITNTLNLAPSLMNRKAKGFSLGQRHRLAYAAAIIRRPKYLILDEPTIGLDPFSWDLIKEHLKSMAQSGVTIILTGHDFNQISEIADNIVIIKNGKVIKEGNINGLLKDNKKTLNILVNNIKVVKNLYPLSTIRIVNNDEYVCIPIEENQDFNKILNVLNKHDVTIKDLNVRSITLKEIYKEFVQKENVSERG